MSFYYWYCLNCKQYGARREEDDRDDDLITHASACARADCIRFKKEGDYRPIDQISDLERVIITACGERVKVDFPTDFLRRQRGERGY